MKKKTGKRISITTVVKVYGPDQRSVAAKRVHKVEKKCNGQISKKQYDVSYSKTGNSELCAVLNTLSSFRQIN